MVKVFVILDSIADKQCKILNNLTPLQYAEIPNINYFSSNARHGFLYPINEKFMPESEDFLLSFFGIDPTKLISGKAPIEAVGAEIKLNNGDLALRINFATMKNNKIIDRRAGRNLSGKETKEFEKSINEGVSLGYEFEFKSIGGHRAVLVIKGEFSNNISNTDYLYKKIGKFGVLADNKNNYLQECKALDPEKNTKITANIVNEFIKQSHEILKSHKVNKERSKNYLLEANYLLCRDAGINLPEISKNENWFASLSQPFELGLAKLSGMKTNNLEIIENTRRDLYDNLFESLNKNIEKTIKEIKKGNYENYFIYLKETSIPSQENKPKIKAKMIELIDNKLFGFLKELNNLNLIITSNNSLPCELRKITNDPIPLLYYDGKNSDSIKNFNETDCLNGSLGKVYAKELMRKFNTNH